MAAFMSPATARSTVLRSMAARSRWTSGTTLTLDNTTATGTTIADNGTVKVDGGKTLNLSGAAERRGDQQSRHHRHHWEQLDQQRCAEQHPADDRCDQDADPERHHHDRRHRHRQWQHSCHRRQRDQQCCGQWRPGHGGRRHDADLDNTTATGTTIADNGTVKVDGGKTLNLSGVC